MSDEEREQLRETFRTIQGEAERRFPVIPPDAGKQPKKQAGSGRTRVDGRKSTGTAGTGAQAGRSEPTAPDDASPNGRQGIKVSWGNEDIAVPGGLPPVLYCEREDCEEECLPGRQWCMTHATEGLPALPDALNPLEVYDRVVRLRTEKAAQDIVAREQAAQGWAPPPEVGFGYLDDLLTAPPRKQPYLVDGLLGRGHNAVLAAPYKTGKTTLGLNLARSLVDGLPFLDRETFLPEGARVGWLNAEMDDADWLDYARPLRIENTGDVAVLNMRGYRLPILNDVAAEWFVNWLKRYEVGALVIDSWRRLCSWSRISENDNEGVERLTDRLDEIKVQSGVAGLLLLAHTGRKKHEEGEEHARGATALDDWVDARWIMTRVGKHDRYFLAEGRRVNFEDTQLIFDEAYNEVTLGEGSRADRRRQAKEATAVGDAALVVSILQQAPDGLDSGTIHKALKEAGITNRTRGNNAMKAGVESGQLTFRRDGKRYIYMAS